MVTSELLVCSHYTANCEKYKQVAGGSSIFWTFHSVVSIFSTSGTDQKRKKDLGVYRPVVVFWKKSFLTQFLSTRNQNETGNLQDPSDGKYWISGCKTQTHRDSEPFCWTDRIQNTTCGENRPVQTCQNRVVSSKTKQIWKMMPLFFAFSLAHLLNLSNSERERERNVLFHLTICYCFFFSADGLFPVNRGVPSWMFLFLPIGVSCPVESFISKVRV